MLIISGAELNFTISDLLSGLTGKTCPFKQD